MNKQASKNVSISKQLIEESAHAQADLVKFKLKYFSAWRKYTLKKRKHSQQQSSNAAASSSSNTKAPPALHVPTLQPSTSEQSNVLKAPLSTVSAPASSSNQDSALNDLYDYDLKSKWLKQCLFCTSSKSVRQLTCNIIQSIFLFYSNSNSQTQNQLTNDILEANSARKFQLAELLCQSLDECGDAGEYFGEYLHLLKLVINDKDCKYRLVLKCGILNKIETLLHREIKYLSDLERLSESSSLSLNDRFSGSMALPTNLTLGYSVKCLTELLALFLKENNIKNKFKGLNLFFYLFYFFN